VKIYAGFWQRAGAFLWDYLIIVCYLMIITILFILTHASEWLFTNRTQAQLSAFLFVTLPVILYFSILESSAGQATWGKNKTGLKVTDHNGTRIIFARSFVRTLLKFIPWEISHTLIWEISFSPQTDSAFSTIGFIIVYLLMGLNIASLLMTKTHQTIYDLLTGTYVEKRNLHSAI
jgi:uncharacterized RDD family membrane protein YckC